MILPVDFDEVLLAVVFFAVVLEDDVLPFEEDFDDSTHNNNSFQNLKTHSIEKIKHDIENLTNNNVLSLYLARLFSIYCKRDVISVQLSNDQITEIFKNLSEETTLTR